MFEKKVILPVILIVAGLVLLVLNLTPKGEINIYGAVSNVLLILGMVLVIIDNRKKPNNRS